MNLLYSAYKALASGLFLSGFPPFWVYTRLSGRYAKGLKERLGFVPGSLVRGPGSSVRIWIHAVSLGEVRVAEPIVECLKGLVPDLSLIFSVTTEHGRDLAVETFEDVPILYAPIDLAFSVRMALLRVRPDVVVFLETEIWPAWIVEAHRMGIKITLVNGRISPRSIEGYLKFKPFFRQVLDHVDAFSMILEGDARRLQQMGADPEKIRINGNAKYELLARKADPDMEAEARSVLKLPPSQLVFVAGSTREGEESIVLDVYEKILRQFPSLVLVIAPRHIKRTPVIESLLRGRGLGYQLRTELGKGGGNRRESILIIDSFGELFNIYSVGTIIFCGGSLVPLGGQNPLEAAIWGKVVFYGPSMEDFLDAKALLESVEAGIEVPDPDQFAAKAIWFLKHPDSLRERGGLAKRAITRSRGASERHARVIAGLL